MALSEHQDWRLKVEYDRQAGPPLERLLELVRGADVASQCGQAVGHDVAITHDGNVLFAYAASRTAAENARRAIEIVLRDHNVTATAVLSHWDERVDEWIQVDPPLTGAAATTEQAHERDAERQESRTLVVSSGKMVREEVEQSMRNWAEQLRLDCEIIEHPHLLTTQVAFTVTGPHRKVDEFAAGLRAEELATLRTERAVMLSPL